MALDFDEQYINLMIALDKQSEILKKKATELFNLGRFGDSKHLLDFSQEIDEKRLEYHGKADISNEQKIIRDNEIKDLTTLINQKIEKHGKTEYGYKRKNPEEETKAIIFFLKEQINELNKIDVNKLSAELVEPHNKKITEVKAVLDSIQAANSGDKEDVNLLEINETASQTLKNTRDYLENTPVVPKKIQNEASQPTQEVKPIPQIPIPQKLSLKEKAKTFMHDVKEKGMRVAVTSRLNNSKLTKQWEKSKRSDFNKVIDMLADYANVTMHSSDLGGKPSFFNPRDWTKEHMQAVSNVLQKYKVNLSISAPESTKPSPPHDIFSLLRELATAINADGKGLNPDGQLNAILKFIEDKCKTQITDEQHREMFNVRESGVRYTK